LLVSAELIGCRGEGSDFSSWWADWAGVGGFSAASAICCFLVGVSEVSSMLPDAGFLDSGGGPVAGWSSALPSPRSHEADASGSVDDFLPESSVSDVGFVIS